MISGGWVPGGMMRRDVWAVAVTEDMASSILAVFWKKTFMTPTPFIDWLSMWSMSFTVVTMNRSNGVTIRVSMSSGDMPAYWKTTAITGMSTLGKMSVGVRKIVTTPMIMTSMAATTNV